MKKLTLYTNTKHWVSGAKGVVFTPQPQTDQPEARLTPQRTA